MTPDARPYHVSGSALIPSSEPQTDLDEDPRGICWMWEPPLSHARYIMGSDCTVGITGWHRSARTEGDHKTDNGAIEVFRINAVKLPLTIDGVPVIDPQTNNQKYILRDLQVAEYAAPVDPVELARVANLLGRVYAGEEQTQCTFIYEAYPGPGVLMTQELLRLGYTNLWMWEYLTDVAEQSNRIGWQSTIQSQKLLWYRSRRHLMERRALIRSKWLIDEYANAVIDLEKMRAKAAYGSHDDRIQAANMCFWAGHAWSYDPDQIYEPVTERPNVDWQQRGPTLGDYQSYKDAWADAVESW